MQQTALNTIAIGIFSLSLFCLVGPLFNVSPAIPAITTFGILGLITIDTLGWQSKGVTLFLDIFASPEERQRIINHEAGHFLVAYFLGIPIAGYTLTAWEAFKQGQSGQAGVTFNTQSLTANNGDPREIRLTVERFCTVWMAGIAAENLAYGNAKGGKEDKEKIRTTLQLAGVPQNKYVQKERWAQLQATTILEKHQQSYRALVEAMQAKASLKDCYQVIQQYCSD